jgi:ketol-acid reductoisomerase
MARMFHQKDVEPNTLSGKTVAVLGYGSQGRAHALNLRDSGVHVVLGLRESGSSRELAVSDGWQPLGFDAAAKDADLVMMLVPDMALAEVYKAHVADHIKPGAMLMFAHGLAIHYGLIEPPLEIDIAMVAPKGPGNLVRREYTQGSGVPCLLAVHQDPSGHAFDLALAYADAIGGTRAGVLTTTFSEETETDLFGEQAVLCGGVTELIKSGWETLVDAGYQPELAYFECMHELKLIVDLIYEGGLSRMHDFVSDTATYGSVTRGPRIIGPGVRKAMEDVLAEIRSGEFAREWLAEWKSGGETFRSLQNAERAHPVESVGSSLRKNMSWLHDGGNP